VENFASFLLDARKRSGLTQAHLAIAAGLTPSYLSFIENGKKPPPSDEVCQRLAGVLEIPADSLLEVAHMQRAPEALQKRVKSLTHSLRREKRSRLRALKSMLSPFLFAGPPGFRESALDALGISPIRRRRIREVLAAVGRGHQEQEQKVSRIVDELPDRERDLLLEKLPGILARASEEDAPPTASTPSRAVEPPLLYGPPEGNQPYRLEIPAVLAGGFADLEASDQIVVDPRVRAAPGDLVVVRNATGFGLRRVTVVGEGFGLVAGDEATGTDEAVTLSELIAWLRQTGAGTVVELRRPYRRGK